MATQAFSVIDAYVDGFVLIEHNVPLEACAEAFVEGVSLPASAYPHLEEMVRELVAGRDYRFADEFDFGLGLGRVLDALDARRQS